MIPPPMKSLLKVILMKKTRIEAFGLAPRFSCHPKIAIPEVTFGQPRNNLPCAVLSNSAILSAVSHSL